MDIKYVVGFMSEDKETPSISIQPSFPTKAAVIIDGGYWDNLRNSVGKPDINIKKLCDSLTSPAFRIRSYFFDGLYEDKQFSYRQSYHNYIQK